MAKIPRRKEEERGERDFLEKLLEAYERNKTK